MKFITFDNLKELCKKLTTDFVAPRAVADKNGNDISTSYLPINRKAGAASIADFAQYAGEIRWENVTNKPIVATANHTHDDLYVKLKGDSAITGTLTVDTLKAKHIIDESQDKGGSSGKKITFDDLDESLQKLIRTAAIPTVYAPQKHVV